MCANFKKNIFKMKKTILWMYNMPLVPEAGGTERITSLIRNGLLKAGYNCMTMLVINPNTTLVEYEGKQVNDIYAFLKSHAVDVVINQDGITNNVLNIFLAKGGLLWQKEGGRIITCLHFDPDSPSFEKLILKKKNKTVKDWVVLLKCILLQGYYKRKKDNQAGILYNELYDKSDVFVCLSRFHFPYLRRVMKRRSYDKMIAINNPLTFDDISDYSILDKKKKQVLVVARMDEFYKRISLILKAWKCLDDMDEWQLVIVGDGPSLNDYKEYSTNNKLCNIHFKGRQSPELYYEDSSIFLMTSDKEGWGLTLTESLQRGVVPVVMNSCPVFSEIINDGENGFLTTNGNVKAFVDKVKFLMNNPEILREMGKRALVSAKKFEIKETIKQWEKIL